MKITKTKEICKYLDRLKNNLSFNYQNDFLDGYVDKEDETQAKKELLLAGQQEFEENPNLSLFIESDEWLNNPYIQSVKFQDIKNKHFSYKKVLIEKGYLFNADSIMDDKDRELKDWMKLRALDEDIETLFLLQDKKEWMMAVPSEFYTNNPYANKAKGKVITFGLGIGYFTYMALLNNKVESITIVEKSEEVIKLFNEIKKYFPHPEKIKVINGDAFDYFNEEYLTKYDYIYADIWQSSEDGRTIIEKLLEKYNPPVDKCDFWIEKSCLNVIRTLIYLYYDENVYNKENKVTEAYKPLMNKVRLYFDSLDVAVSDVNLLKDYMYDTKVIRGILAIRS